MNLISCDSCGVVLDKNKLRFPEDIWTEDGCVDMTKAVWKDKDHKPFVPCPVCKEPVTE